MFSTRAVTVSPSSSSAVGHAVILHGNPDDLTTQPTVAKANADGDAMMVLMVKSKTMSRLQTTDYIVRYLQPRLATVDGVAQVQVFGQQSYSMRIWLDPEALAAHSLAVDDVATALTRNNVQLPAGALHAATAPRAPTADARGSHFQLHSRPPRQRLPSSLVIESASASAPWSHVSTVRRGTSDQR